MREASTTLHFPDIEDVVRKKMDVEEMHGVILSVKVEPETKKRVVVATQQECQCPSCQLRRKLGEGSRDLFDFLGGQ